jgi:hypothetical protein
VMAPAGHNTPTTSPVWESRPRLLNTLVFPDERRAVYTDVTQITRSYYDLFLVVKLLTAGGSDEVLWAGRAEPSHMLNSGMKALSGMARPRRCAASLRLADG